MPEELEEFTEIGTAPQASIFVVGDTVRFADIAHPLTLVEPPNAAALPIKELNFNSPMVVLSINSKTLVVRVTREGREIGRFPEAGLVKVSVPPANPPAPMVPDAIP